MSFGSKRETCIIEDGPSREILFDALKYAYDENAKVPVDFMAVLEVKPGSSKFLPIKIKDTKITGIDHEDGHGQAFVIRGFMHACFYPEVNERIVPDTKYQKCQFIACYSAQTKRGRISFLVL